MNAAEIVPTILTNDPEQYKMLIAKFQPFAKRVQVDIADGTFAPAITIPVNNVWWPQVAPTVSNAEFGYFLRR